MATRTPAPAPRRFSALWLLRKFAANTGRVLVVAVLVTLLSVGISVATSDWTWFQRSGSLLTIAAIALAGRAMIRAGRAGLQPKSSFSIGTMKRSYVDDRGRMMVDVQPSAETVARRREERRDDTAALAGFVLAVLGTLIWGYGDLAPKVPLAIVFLATSKVALAVIGLMVTAALVLAVARRRQSKPTVASPGPRVPPTSQTRARVASPPRDDSAAVQEAVEESEAAAVKNAPNRRS